MEEQYNNDDVKLLQIIDSAMTSLPTTIEVIQIAENVMNEPLSTITNETKEAYLLDFESKSKSKKL